MKKTKAFTLIELLTVIAVIAILASILVPTFGKIRERALITSSMSNLRSIGVAMMAYSADNNGWIPGARTPPDSPHPNNSNKVRATGWWQLDLNHYVDGEEDVNLNKMAPAFTDPVYLSLIGEKNDKVWKSGFAMNARMPFAAGETSGQATRSDNVRTKLIRYPSNTIFVGPGYFEYFLPQPDGTVGDTQFSDNITSRVDHGRRIGADSKGDGGNSALYLFIDGSVRQLEPGEGNSDDPNTAAYYLKRKR